MFTKYLRVLKERSMSGLRPIQGTLIWTDCDNVQTTFKFQLVPATISQGVGTSDNDQDFIGPKNRPRSASGKNLGK